MAYNIKPLGFPKCPSCPYLQSGTPARCFTCAQETMEQLAEKRCVVCSMPIEAEYSRSETCGNNLCRSKTRAIEKVTPISYYHSSKSAQSGPPDSLSAVIRNYKYHCDHKEKNMWAGIFARLVIGWLNNQNPDDIPDLIIANPTYTENEEEIGHTERVLTAAAKEDSDQLYHFDTNEPRLLLKVGLTKKLSSCKNQTERDEVSETLKPLLKITDKSSIEGKRILVYDDIATQLKTMNIVAEFLKNEGGAKSVTGLVLARTLW